MCIRTLRSTDASGQSSRHPAPRGRRGHRSVSRSRSRSHSRASLASLDEMLLEATTGDDPDRRVDSNGVPILQQQPRHPHGAPLSAHPSQHLSPNAPVPPRRQRSMSNERDREYLAIPYHTSRSRGSSQSHPSLHPSSSMSNVVISLTRHQGLQHMRPIIEFPLVYIRMQNVDNAFASYYVTQCMQISLL